MIIEPKILIWPFSYTNDYRNTRTDYKASILSVVSSYYKFFVMIIALFLIKIIFLFIELKTFNIKATSPT